MTENMAYYTERLQCSDEEKDACLETLAKLYHLRESIQREGALVAEVLAEEEPDPFFRTCLQEWADTGFQDSVEQEQRFNQYLMAGNYRGGAFLNAVLISQGLVLLSRFLNGAYFEKNWDWDQVLSEALRGYFGVEYREKVIATLKREVSASQGKRECSSLLPDFDKLTALSPQQRDWLMRQFPSYTRVQQFASVTLCRALKGGGSAVTAFLLDGAENREELERDLENTYNVRAMDVEAAQREILEKAKEAPAFFAMAGSDKKKTN